MASAIYPKFLEHALNVSLKAGAALPADVKACLVPSTYVYDPLHEFLSSVTGIEETSGTLATTTVTNGIFDAADITFTATAGVACNALILYIDSGTGAATSRLIKYDDTIAGFPVTLGGDITITWNATGIFTVNFTCP